jgi:hypothetical protein
VSIRTYQVGFGDCFLFSVSYSDASERHLLFDFGSMVLPEGAPKRMTDVAKDIAKRSGGKLTAVIATHRHKDHISGFNPGKTGRGTGAIIAGLKPDLVVQPWTENPDLPIDATGPAPAAMTSNVRRAAMTTMALHAMHAVAHGVVEESKRSRHFSSLLKRQLRFIGEDNIKNAEAVRNLMGMAPNEYVHFGVRSGLEKLLPGVKVHVLGPPTVDQSADVKKQNPRNAAEFWHLQALGLAVVEPRVSGDGGALFPDYVMARPPNFPIEARWLVKQARKIRGEQLLQLVRKLDDAMNNTSVILLLEIGDKGFLFPGDAQWENWAYALSKPDICALLAKVNVYKVGHHGSLNATPKTLWRMFENRSQIADGARLISLMSTLGGHHGHAAQDGHGTEVPRESLVKELRRDTDLVNTAAFAPKIWFEDTVVGV